MKQIKKHIFDIKLFVQSSEIAFILCVEIFAGIVASIISLLLFWDITFDIFNTDVAAFDTYIIHIIFAWRNPFLTHIMFFLSFLGNTGIIMLVIGSVFFLWFLKHQREAILFGFIMIMGEAINTLLKDVIHRTRPTLSPLTYESSYSFPSGHAMVSFVFFATLAFLMYHFTRNKPVSICITVCFALLVLLIGISRIYLGVHYPSDVIGGYIAGFWWFSSVILLDRTLIFYKMFQEHKNKIA